MTVRLDPAAPAGRLLSRLPSALPDDVAAALDLAARLGAGAPSPGDGATRDLWETLATLAPPRTTSGLLGRSNRTWMPW